MPSCSPIAFQRGELVGCDPAGDRQMVRRRPQVLTDRDDVASDSGEVGERADDLVVGLAEADHHPRLRDETLGLRLRQHREAPGVAGRGTHGALQAGDRLEVVVEHVGPDVEERFGGRRASP